MLSNNHCTPVANGHKVAAGGSVARGTLAFDAEQLKKAEAEAERWHKLYGKLYVKRDQEDASLPKVCTRQGVLTLHTPLSGLPAVWSGAGDSCGPELHLKQGSGTSYI